MSNLKKYVFAAAILTVAGGVYLNNLHRSIPADLRDAVASEGAAGQLQESAPQAEAAEIPVPKAVASEFKADNAASGGVMIKGFHVRSGLDRFSKSAHKGSLKGASANLSALAMMQEETGVEGATPFEVLKNLYAKGEPATEKDLTGWYSGRAVYGYNPNDFEGALIFGRRSPTNPEGGPLFQGKTEFMLTSAIPSEAGHPDFYDSLTPTKISAIKSLSPIVISFPAAEGKIGHGTIQYRKIKGYIFEYLFETEPKSGKLYEAYDYYYLNVTPPSQGGPLFN